MVAALLDSFRLVLVRPQFGGNLGACARVLSNFGLHDCVLVNSFCSTHDTEAKRYATNEARYYLEQMKDETLLSRALGDCHAAIGFTCRGGSVRQGTIEIQDIASLAGAGKKVALVFGNEKVGLNGEELAQCTHACHIPTADVHKSLNLSHAVAVVLGRIYAECRKAGHAPLESRSEASDSVTMVKLDALKAKIRTVVEGTYAWQRFDSLGRDRAINHIYRVLGRAQLSADEFQIFSELFADSLESENSRNEV